MNHVYRIIWSVAANTYIAVAETAGSRGKRSLGKRMRALRALALMTSLIAGANALANPNGGAVSAGQGSIASSGAITTINQATPKMAINWQGFNIAAGETVNFVQPGSSAVALNRVLGTDGSQILGQLNANGHVYILNPNGVLFGKDAQVSVGALVASTLQMSDSDFMTGKTTFSGQGGAVTNYGNITANGGGYVALLGGKVNNEGTITAKMGAVALGAGERVTLDFSGDGLLKMAVDRGLADALTRNSGLIQAEGGSVVMAAKTADELRASVVNNEGVIQARSLENHGGVIRLSGTQILNSGTLDAAGSSSANGGSIAVDASYAMQNSGSLNVSGAQGGSIKVNTHNLVDMGQYDASGSVQGGSIRIVADNHMEQTTAATLKADGGEGSGGTIRIFAAHDAWLSGSISVDGRTGGEIAVTAADLVMAGASLSAAGKDSGGRIRIGGGWQGSDADLPNAAQTRLVDTHLDVSATKHGNGGTAVVWSDNATLFGGQVNAKGGAAGGDGGKVEVSSHGQLSFGGNVDTAAPKGRSGQLLLDPKNIEIVDSVSGILILPLAGFTPAADVQFGGASIVEVPFSNAMLIASPHDKYVTAGDNGGAVRLYNSTTGALNGTLSGTSAGDQVGSGGIIALGNGNYIVNSPLWSNPVGNAKVGAVTWLGSALTLPASISTLNSLIGSTTNDQVGSGGIVVSTYANSLGNYLVKSPLWNYLGTTQRAGAVSLGSGISGTKGNVNSGSSGNSLSGSTLDDQVGSGDVKFLPSGNFVVSSPAWDDVASSVSNAGAVTYMKAIAPSGLVSAVNSLFGTTPNDQVGSGGVTVLANSNYLVSSPNWSISSSNSIVGAVSFGISTGLMGKVDNSNTANGNSLSGSLTGDMVSSGGIDILTNGNYVVMSPNWSNGSANSKAGAVTWGGSTTALKGVVSATGNSLTGSNKNDQVGSDGIEALTNGNYVVVSQHWANGTANPNAGAVTFASGTVATKTTVSSTNSLVGALSGDTVGSGGVTLLSNGNYVVSSPNWSNGSANHNAGAVTWGSSTAALKGVVSTTANSLTGSITNDFVGSGGIKALLNGNYVVDSPYWNNVGTISTATSAGAVSWMNGSSVVKGTVSTLNSLYGTSNNDRVGYDGVTVLGNGNYVVGSQSWAAGSGAVNWGSASVGAKGVVSTANSLIGKFGDQVGSGGITELSNGNYVVNSPKWSVSSSTGQVGAVTKLTGTGVSSGIVSSTNSFTGSQANDAVGSGGITALTNGNFVVRSPDWHKGTISGAGAVSWVQSGAEVGVVSVANSLLGSSENDNIGSGAVRALPDGRALVASPLWDTPGASNAGRVDILASAFSLNNNFQFNSLPSATSTVLISALTNQLGNGDVTLQANNDITLNSALVSSGGGALKLQAGRSVRLNANITTGDRNLTIVANETKANGVVPEYRDAGIAEILTASGTSINAGTGNVDIAMHNGAGLNDSSSGNIGLNIINANTISVTNGGTITATNDARIVLSGLLKTTATSGDAIRIAGGAFTNDLPASDIGVFPSPLSVSSGSRWLIWSVSPDKDFTTGMINKFKRYGASYNGPTTIATDAGNGLLYSVSPQLTISLTGTATKTYDASLGATLNTSSTGNYRIDNVIAGDTVKIVRANANYDTANAGEDKNVSVVDLDISVSKTSFNSLTSNTVPVYGYVFNTAANGNIGVINKADLSITTTAVTKTYDGNRNANGTAVAVDNKQLFGTTKLIDGTFTFDNKNVGDNKSVTVDKVTIDDGNGGKNYNLPVYVSNTLSKINKADLGITSTAVTKTYDGTTSANGTAVAAGSTQLFGNDKLTGGTFAFDTKHVGENKTVAVDSVTIDDGNSGGNYNFTGYVNNTASSITKANLGITSTAVTKTYDGTTSANGTAVAAGSTQLFNGDKLTGGTFVFDTKHVGENKAVAVDSVTIDDGNSGGNYNFSGYVNNTASSITKANLGITTTAVTKTYDGTTSASGVAIPADPKQLFSGDSLKGGTFTFDTKHVGENKTVTIDKVTIDDGNGGANYGISYVNNTNSTITPTPLTLSTGDVSKLYDGTVAATGKPVVVSGTLFSGDTLSGGTYAFTDPTIGTGKTVIASNIDVHDGNNGANYLTSYANNTASSIFAVKEVTDATEQAGAIVAATLQNRKQPGADRRCILDQSKCIAALEGLPLTISGAGMRLPESLK